jgi:phosphate transport system substrate-binding protein
MIIRQFFCYFFAIFLCASFGAKANISLKGAAKKRAHIQIVGSSTVYPFAAVIAETFGRDTEFKTPIVEATGTGGGFKLFCSGVGYNFPDFINASRKIEENELAKCHENGVNGVVEIRIGYDGIVLSNSNEGQKYSLTKQQIFLALADKVPDAAGKLVKNPYKKWSDIDAKLPQKNIAIYGPPSTSGTRDAFAELALESVCAKMPQFVAAYSDAKTRKKKCHTIRDDGAFIEAGENDNLIVQKLRNDHDALGIFGFSFLEENHHLIQAADIDNMTPTFDSIMSQRYSLSRPLFIYFKKEHLNLVPGMSEFVREIVSKNTIGKDGYLLQKGLIPLREDELQKVQKDVL